MSSEGTRVLSAYDDENRQLKEQLAAAQASSRPSAGPTALYGAGGRAAYDAAGGGAIAGAQARRELKVIRFSATPAATGGGRKSAPTSTLFAAHSPTSPHPNTTP